MRGGRAEGRGRSKAGGRAGKIPRARTRSKSSDSDRLAAGVDMIAVPRGEDSAMSVVATAPMPLSPETPVELPLPTGEGAAPFAFKPQTPEKKKRKDAKMPPKRRSKRAHAEMDQTPVKGSRVGKRPATPRSLTKALSEPDDSWLSRRPTRRPKSAAMTEEQIAEMLRKCEEPGLDKVHMPEMGGYGVFATKEFYQGDFVCEYSGDLIDMDEAQRREQGYIAEDLAKGVESSMCYMYYLKHEGKKWCVDATKSGRIGRLINHSKLHPNLRTRLFIVDGTPRLGLCAIKGIAPGTELFYDYGERDPKALRAHPWLKS